ncbi:MAG: hypothetical protein HFG91_03305 [Acholeplasmatales bacterium]|jgi:NitT/TauT family transport system substrate-binding protein|nr:hypothetical protein [Acholeplasmatales bacterium]
MKKLYSLFLLFLGIVLFSCKQEDKIKEINIYMPDGTPALALANVMDQGFQYEEINANFHIVQASEIAARVSQDSCDMAIMPTTSAANIFTSGVELKLASVNVFGNLYITGTHEVESLEELKGKRILTTGATTLQMVEYILKNNQIPYEEAGAAIEGKVALTVLNDASEIIPLLKQAVMKKTELYGVLGEPQVTKAQSVISELKIAVDLQKEYKTITGFDGYPQACLIVKNNLLLQNKAWVEKFLSTIEDNEDYLKNNTTNLPEVFKKYESNLANMSFTADTIKRCNIRLEYSLAVKNSVIAYIKALTNKEVNESFFY